MEKTVCLQAYAKINLGLDVLGKREDGYHELRMLMQTVDIYDEVKISRREDGDIRIKLHYPLLEGEAAGQAAADTGLAGENNIAYKAARLLREHCRLRQGVEIEIIKNIPIAAGMAGGSTDAAAVLKGMNTLFSLGLPKEDLAELGLRLGADVPYCLMGGTALAEGIGEKLKPLEPLPELPLVIAKPDIHVSTKEVYANLHLESLGEEERPDIDGILPALDRRDGADFRRCMKNVMERYTARVYPIVGEIKAAMLAEGAFGSMMSGSGPSVFGVFTGEDAADACFSALQKGKYGSLATQIYRTRIKNI